MFIAETESFIAILEKKPLVLGHVVVISKRIEDHFFDLSSEELSSILPFAKRLSTAIQKTIPCKKVGVAVIGLETRHAHLHLVPLTSADDLNFTKPKLTPSDSELNQVLSQMRSILF